MKRFDIEGFNKYSFGLDGSVYHKRLNRLLKGCITKKGYIQFNIYDNDNIMKGLQQHKIVYKLFNKNYKLFQGMKMVIDHINSNKLDNHISNLRLITNRENASKERTTKSGLSTGVSINKICTKKRYYSRISINNKQINLGYFNTEQEAHQAYLDAKKIYHII